MVDVVEDSVEQIRRQVVERGDLRTLWRRRLLGGRGVELASHRRPADLRVRRPWAATSARRKVERDFVDATRVDLHVTEAAKRFLDALGGVSDPEEKRQDRRSSSAVFEQAAADIVGRPPSTARRCSFSSRAPSTRTSWSPAAARGPRTSSRTTTSVAAGRPRVRAGRAAADALQGRGPAGR